MIDFDDVGDVGMMVGFGGMSVIGIVIFLVFLAIALVNANECETKHCPNGATPTLQNHACQCVIEAQ